MRVFDNGCFYTVQCTEADVAEFARSWPCYGPHVPLSFQFDKRTGDLVDMAGDDTRNDPTGVVALSQDAQAYGKRRLQAP